jgi:hypothetical protein
MEGHIPMEMNAEDAPQWLRNAFENQTNMLTDLTNRLRTYEEREAESNQQTTPTTMSQDIARRPKPHLPNPDKFDGKDMALFPQFEGTLRAKLEIDGGAIGGEKEQVWYGFGRLAGDAAGRIYPWIGYAQETGNFTVKGLFEQMRIAFCDPRQRQKALSQLNRTKQGSRALDEFLNEFNRLILEAHGWGWEDFIKKGYLKAALSMKILEQTIGIAEKESYEDYCSQLRMVNDQMIEIKDLSANRSWGKSKETAKATGSGPPRTEPDAMDWEPSTAVATVRTTVKEPRWASPEEVERRR